MKWGCTKLDFPKEDVIDLVSELAMLTKFNPPSNGKKKQYKNALDPERASC
jgi:hypothetical protein